MRLVRELFIFAAWHSTGICHRINTSGRIVEIFRYCCSTACAFAPKRSWKLPTVYSCRPLGFQWNSLVEWRPHCWSGRMAAIWFACKSLASILGLQLMTAQIGRQSVLILWMMVSNNFHHRLLEHPTQNVAATWTFRLPVLHNWFVMGEHICHAENLVSFTVAALSNRNIFLYLLS